MWSCKAHQLNTGLANGVRWSRPMSKVGLAKGVRWGRPSGLRRLVTRSSQANLMAWQGRSWNSTNLTSRCNWVSLLDLVSLTPFLWLWPILERVLFVHGSLSVGSQTHEVYYLPLKTSASSLWHDEVLFSVSDSSVRRWFVLSFMAWLGHAISKKKKPCSVLGRLFVCCTEHHEKEGSNALDTRG